MEINGIYYCDVCDKQTTAESRAYSFSYAE